MRARRLLGLGLIAAVPAVALGFAPAALPPGHPPVGQSALPPGHPPITREDAVGRAGTMFDRIDADRDGYVTRAEAEAASDRMQGERAARMKARADRAFAALDTDRNGQISKGEFDAAHSARGGVATGERGPARGMRGGGGAMAGRMFDRIDVDRDGRISRAEAEKAAQDRFARRDRDGDGRIEPQEMPGRRMSPASTGGTST